jgi:hypothetical protein
MALNKGNISASGGVYGNKFEETGRGFLNIMIDFSVVFALRLETEVD